MDLRWGAAFLDCEVLAVYVDAQPRERTKIKEWCSWADQAKTAI